MLLVRAPFKIPGFVQISVFIFNRGPAIAIFVINQQWQNKPVVYNTFSVHLQSIVIESLVFNNYNKFLFLSKKFIKNCREKPVSFKLNLNPVIWKLKNQQTLINKVNQYSFVLYDIFTIPTLYYSAYLPSQYLTIFIYQTP